jgi:GNAT superfamily N-acetyltransferase
VRIDLVRDADLGELLPMVRAYCDFYKAEPPDERLEAISRRLIERPEEGAQLIARDDEGEALGFATLYMSWNTLRGDRFGIMHDLFVRPEHRGRGVADELIAACRRATRERGGGILSWQTAPSNHRAQRVYERVGAKREQWIDYWMDVISSG